MQESNEQNQSNPSEPETPTGSTDETVAISAGSSSGNRRPQPGRGPKYELVRALGKGGFAWVYLVKNLDLDRLEALKILASKIAEQDDVVDRFVKEARTSAGFNHQNIVTIYEVQRIGHWSLFKVPDKVKQRHEEPFVYFTMSFVEGDTATQLIKKRGKIEQKRAVKIAMDTCKALEYAHGKGVVHRDIKPDNILVDRRNQGIVSDFGIAKVADQTRMTAAGTFMGTARYVSPEQAMGDEIDGRSDLYSLGITLYEMVTGTVPFDSEAWMTVLYQHINQAPEPPEAVNKEINRDLQAVILKLLEKKPENRYQSAREAFHVLASVYQKLGGDDASTAPFDEIDTRANVMRSQATDATVIRRHDGAKPPVRAAEGRATPQKKRQFWPWLGAAVLILAALIFIPRYLPGDDRAGPAPIPTGQLMVSAYPTGSLIKVTDANGQDVEIEASELPSTLSLPQGEYTLYISYNGMQEKCGALVDPNRLARAHAEFAFDDELLLLGDL